MQGIYGPWHQTSELLSKEHYKDILNSVDRVLERDQHGIKVAVLTNGDIFKVFRVKHLISSARIFSYARSFCRNAERLKQFGVPTVEIKMLYRIEGSANTAVVYRPLPGDTMMQLLKQKMLSEQLAEELGQFIAKLHDMGIYFRGLHFGNIVLNPAGQFGLIDISEMTIFPWRLGRRRRLRNFARFWRSHEDKFAFGYSKICSLINGYFQQSRAVPIKLKLVQERLM